MEDTKKVRTGLKVELRARMLAHFTLSSGFHSSTTKGEKWKEWFLSLPHRFSEGRVNMRRPGVKGLNCVCGGKRGNNCGQTLRGAL
jgi:hypothetical protein